MAVSGGTKSWSRLEPNKMPAWKLEVLERKRQKMASGGGALSSRGKEVSPSRHSRKGSPERLVLQDSLGPLHENPFIKLEQERRRRRPQHHQHHHQQPSSAGRATSPIRHLLDIYGNVPGIRTIRAENIIIIESDPGYFTQSSHGAGSDPVEELLAKRGSKVAEIRASEVVIYEPEPPVREPLKKNQVVPTKKPLDHSEVLEEAGRVSRLLEKFDHGHSRPLRSRSWENLLERDNKPPLLPKPPPTDRHSHVPQTKAPKRSGEISPSSASILEEDSKRFPLNNPSWLPSKPPAVHTLPDPGLFHKRPPSPITPPATSTPGSSPSSLSPLSPCYDMPTDEKLVSPIVATVREKFEVGYTNNHPLSKLMNVTQKTGSNTIHVNPKAASLSKARPSDTTIGTTVKSSSPITNGHADYSEINANTSSTITIQDLLSKSKRSRGTPTRRSSEGSGAVLSPGYDSTNELPKGANDWRPKSEVNSPKNSIPPLSSASHSESSFHNHCDNSFTSATPSQLMKVSFPASSNDSFEIRPAPKPDLSKIPDDDVQAKALANIRMQSKNSFVFIPKKRQDPSAPVTGSAVQVSTKNKPKVQVSASTFNGPKLDSRDSPGENSVRLKEVLSPVNGDERIEQIPSSVTVKSTVPLLSDFDWRSGLLPSKSSTEGQSFTDIGAELEYFSSVHQGDAEGILTVPVTKIPEDVAKTDIPVTNIDDIVNADEQDSSKEAKPTSKLPTDPVSASYRPHTSLSSVRAKGTNTFTVIPKRKPITEKEAFRTPVVDEDDDEDSSSKRKSSDGFEAPYSELGALLKKRYPTAEEIQVIGGYQSLSKSCLLKNGSTRKKMKISFNEQNIHTMFEYPSENSLVEDTAEEEVNDASGSESEEEEKTSGLFIPRATFGSSGATSNGLQAKSNSGLSSYTPKHSVAYSKWQDEKTQERPASPDSLDSEGMLTPDYGDSHSHFRSEPALYF